MFEEDRFWSARPVVNMTASNYHRWIYSRCAFMSSVIGRDMSGRVHTTSARRKGTSHTSVNFRSTSIDVRTVFTSMFTSICQPGHGQSRLLRNFLQRPLFHSFSPSLTNMLNSTQRVVTDAGVNTSLSVSL